MKRTILLLALALAAVAVWAQTNLGFEVGGVTVTSSNYQNVTGRYITGNGTNDYKVSYDPSTNTLTLRNVKIARSGSYNRAIYNQSCSGLTICFEGDNELSAQNAAPMRFDVASNITCANGGHASITGDTQDGIYFSGTTALRIQNADLDIVTTGSVCLAGESGKRNQLTIANSDVQCTSPQREVVKYVRNLAVNKSTLVLNGNTSYNTLSDITQLSMGQGVSVVEPVGGTFYSSLQTIALDGTAVMGLVALSDQPAEIDIDNSGYFYDANLKTALKALSIGADGKLSFMERYNTTELNLSNSNISSLTGLDLFFHLKRLNCFNNNLTLLETLKFPRLEYLDCSGNNLTSLNLSQNYRLNSLHIYKNKITASGMNTIINSLPAANNGNLSLYYANALNESNTYSRQNVESAIGKGWTPYYRYESNGTVIRPLNGLIVDANIIPDVAFRAYLSGQRYCNKFHIPYSSIDSIQEMDLNQLNIYNAKGIENFTALTWLRISNNYLETLDVSTLTHLSWLGANGNKIATLNLGDASELTSLIVSQNKLTTFAMPANNKLQSLSIYNNYSLKSLDVSGSQFLQEVKCNNCDLELLNVANCSRLNLVDCYGNNLRGEGMGNFVTSLPTVTNGTLHVYRRNDSDQNRITTAQVQQATGKGWKVYYHPAPGATGADWTTYGGCTMYDIWVNGTQLDTEGHNFPDIGLTFTAPKTLRLNNVDLRYTSSSHPAIESSIEGLTIYVTGEGNIRSNNDGIKLLGGGFIRGGGKLAVNVGGNGLVLGNGTRIYEDTQMTIEATGAGIMSDNGTILVINGENTQVKVKGAQVVDGLGTLTLQDGLAITEPAGTTFSTSLGTLVDRNGNPLSGTWVTIAKAAFAMGDINGDGMVDVTDVSLLIDVVLGKMSENDINGAPADVNGDGMVDVTDVSQVIDIVLGKAVI